MTRFDLVIAGGTVIDAGSGVNDLRDVGIVDGRIAAIEPSLATADAREAIDATGRYVVPGLVDLHVHVYPGVADLSVDADATCLGRGVTTVVDGGSAGANTWPGFRRWVVDTARTRVLAFLNISLLGQVDTHLGELHDLRFADPERAARVAVANPDRIVGFKVRLSGTLAGENGLEGLRRALWAGRATGLPVMAHIGGTPFDIESALALMGAGDIVTHSFTGWNPGGIVDDEGRVLPAARDARARGVRFDIGHGGGSFSWATAEAAIAEGFEPDTISTDLHRFNVAGPVGDLPETMSKLLHLGLPLERVIEAATSAPAASVGAAGRDLGRLVVGGPADVTVLGLQEAPRDLADSLGATRTVTRHLVPTAVVRAGAAVPIRPRVTEPPAGISPG
ncbi:MAG TPA: amidohydrolase/deacetylase family metallohydrolase [Candidatus Limnocylindrales bacterium]|nr:amidohydrolase/deacetylase family metallohydrolase [Candidatus Limnocylindrales bacterium]